MKRILVATCIPWYPLPCVTGHIDTYIYSSKNFRSPLCSTPLMMIMCQIHTAGTIETPRKQMYMHARVYIDIYIQAYMNIHIYPHARGYYIDMRVNLLSYLDVVTMRLCDL